MLTVRVMFCTTGSTNGGPPIAALGIVAMLSTAKYLASVSELRTPIHWYSVGFLQSKLPVLTLKACIPEYPCSITIESVHNMIMPLAVLQIREVRISWYQLFSVVYFIRGTLGKKRKAPSWGTDRVTSDPINGSTKVPERFATKICRTRQVNLVAFCALKVSLSLTFSGLKNGKPISWQKLKS